MADPWLDPFGGPPASSLILQKQAVGEAVAPMPESSGLGFHNFFRRDGIEVQTARHRSVSKKRIESLRSDHHHVRAGAIRNVFRQPSVADRNVSGFANHVVAKIARLVFEKTVPPITAEKFRGGFGDCDIATVALSDDSNRVANGRAVGKFRAKIYGSQFIGGDAALPGKHFGKGGAFEMAANDANGEGHALLKNRRLAAGEAQGFDKTGNANHRVATWTLKHLYDNPRHFHRVIAGFCLGTDFLGRGRNGEAEQRGTGGRRGLGCYVHDVIHQPTIQQLHQQPRGEAARRALGAEIRLDHPTSISSNMVSNMWLKLSLGAKNFLRQLIFVRHTVSKRAHKRGSGIDGSAFGLTRGHITAVFIQLDPDSRVKCRTGTTANAAAVLHDRAEQVGGGMSSGSQLLLNRMGWPRYLNAEVITHLVTYYKGEIESIVFA